MNRHIIFTFWTFFTISVPVLGQSPPRDQYGGWTGKTFEATGYFRVESTDRRQWLVTPEGNAYLIQAMDHVDWENVSRPYNETFWTEKLSLSREASDDQKVSAFFAQKIRPDQAYLGFNCLYRRVPPAGEEFTPFIPIVRSVDIEYWRTWRPSFSAKNFLDVFSDSFAKTCEQQASAINRNGWASNPWIVGYALTDCPVLTEIMSRPRRSGFFHKPLPGTTTWPVALRNLGADAAGKQAYVELMRTRYDDDVERFNDAYNTAFTSWHDLLEARDWRKRTDPTGNLHEEQDNAAFLLQILEKSWSTQVAAIRKLDPNHLIMGDTLNLNEPIPDQIIELYARFFPIIT